jgi:dTDP-L-rhamnose 4-epimerase
MAVALVTGGEGLIGSHVVDLLRLEGRQVRSLNLPSRPDGDPGRDWLRDDVEYLKGDVRDRDVLRRALADVDLLVHLAAFGGFAPGIAPYFDVNVTAYATMLEVAEEIGAPLRRAMVASTQAVYGEGTSRCPEHGRFRPAPRMVPDMDAGRWEVTCPRCGRAGSPVPTREDDSADSRTPYAVSKLCLEETALRLGAARGIGTTMLRFALTYGPRQSAANPYVAIIALFCQRMLRGEEVLVFEDGAQTRDFVHVADVARAVLHLVPDTDSHGRRVNVGTGTGTSVAEVVAVLAEMLGVEAEPARPGWFRPGDVRHLVTDAGVLRASGWQPRVSLRSGLAGFVSWMRDRPLPDDPFREGLARMRAAGIVRAPGADGHELSPAGRE